MRVLCVCAGVVCALCMCDDCVCQCVCVCVICVLLFSVGVGVGVYFVVLGGIKYQDGIALKYLSV